MREQSTNDIRLELAGAVLVARGSGALHWPDMNLLCVSDLHLGKAERVARRTGTILPPYEVQDTLQRLDAEIEATSARIVVCLGDSFDDPAAAQALGEETRLWLSRMQAGRRWIWIEGNHDPGPVDMGGEHLQAARFGPLVFRHIARPGAAPGEISGHYHPKVSLPTRARRLSRPAFLADSVRVILPAFGTYTGGLNAASPVLSDLFAADARAILTGPRPRAVPYSPG